MEFEGKNSSGAASDVSFVRPFVGGDQSSGKCEGAGRARKALPAKYRAARYLTPLAGLAWLPRWRCQVLVQLRPKVQLVSRLLAINLVRRTYIQAVVERCASRPSAEYIVRGLVVSIYVNR